MQCYQSCELDPDFWGTSTGWCPGSSNAKLFLPPWAWWICMAKQKYSTAAGFHIWLLPFTLSPKARPQQKSEWAKQHHPAGHQLDCYELLQIYVSFFTSLFATGSGFLLSPSSLFPPASAYSFSFLEANGKGSKNDRRLPPMSRLCPPSGGQSYTSGSSQPGCLHLPLYCQ